MAYNQKTQGEQLAERMTARQAVPRNLDLRKPRNLHMVRHASEPSNDAYLKFDKASTEIFPNLPSIIEGETGETTITMVIEMEGGVDVTIDFFITALAVDDTPVTELPGIEMVAGTTAEEMATLIAGEYAAGVLAGAATVTATSTGNMVTFITDTGVFTTGPLVSIVEADDAVQTSQTTQADEPEPEEKPQISFKTHAESNEWLANEQLDAPTGWDVMTLAEKAAWANQ